MSVPFDQREGVIWFNGEMVPWNDAKTHVVSHGLHYGGCVFEGERVYNGNIFKLEEHTQRLFDSAKIIGFEIPYTVEDINEACRQCVTENNLTEAYVRPVAWRGSGEMGISAKKTGVHVAIAAWEWPKYFFPKGEDGGIHLITANWRRPDPATAPTQAKAAGLYMIATMAKHQAEAAGYDDALMLDWQGRVAESTGSNIFVIKDGHIRTPIADCFLDGITRRTVMGLAKDMGHEVEEVRMMPNDLTLADEIFVTGTAAEITPVGGIDETRYKTGPITKKLQDAYSKLVRMDPEDQKVAKFG